MFRCSKTALAEYVRQGGRLLLSGVHVAEQYGRLTGVQRRIVVPGLGSPETVL